MPRAKAKTNNNLPFDHEKKWETYVISEAKAILKKRLQKPRRKEPITSSVSAIRLAEMVLTGEEREHFWVAYFNTRHQLIEHKILFSGTVNGASVYPREVVKEALKLNATAIIVAHNHPSGNPTPSMDDKAITRRLRDALELVDIRLLDHIIVGHGKSLSMADKGLIYS